MDLLAKRLPMKVQTGLLQPARFHERCLESPSTWKRFSRILRLWEVKETSKGSLARHISSVSSNSMSTSTWIFTVFFRASQV